MGPWRSFWGGGRGFDSRWGNWNFHYLRPGPGPGIDTTSNRCEYQEYLLGGLGGQSVPLTTSPSSCAGCLEILGASTSCSPSGLSSRAERYLYLQIRSNPNFRIKKTEWNRSRIVLCGSRHIKICGAKVSGKRTVNILSLGARCRLTEEKCMGTHGMEDRMDLLSWGGHQVWPCDVVLAVICQALIVATSPIGICGGHSGVGEDLHPSTLIFPCHCH